MLYHPHWWFYMKLSLCISVLYTSFLVCVMCGEYVCVAQAWVLMPQSLCDSQRTYCLCSFHPLAWRQAISIVSLCMCQDNCLHPSGDFHVSASHFSMGTQDCRYVIFCPPFIHTVGIWTQVHVFWWQPYPLSCLPSPFYYCLRKKHTWHLPPPHQIILNHQVILLAIHY